MILTGQEGWRTLKRSLDTQIATLEPYIESMPSTFTYATIMTTELWAKKNLAFQHMGDEEKNTIFHTNFFIFTATSSVLVSNFGVVKFFKNGPTRFLSSEGPLSGFGSSKAVLTFLAVLFTNLAKGGFLVEIVLNQVVERWFLSLLSSGPENLTQITLYTRHYRPTRTLYRKLQTQDQTQVYKAPSQYDPDNYLLWNMGTNMWTFSFNNSCSNSTELPTCSLDLLSTMDILPGDWTANSIGFENFFLWSGLFLLPPLLLSLCVLSWPGLQHLCHLLLLHPQLLLTPAFSHFCPGPIRGEGSSRLSVSRLFTWLNILLNVSACVFTIKSLTPYTWPVMQTFFRHTREAHDDHKILAGFCLGCLTLSLVFTLLVLYLPCFQSDEVNLLLFLS